MEEKEFFAESAEGMEASNKIPLGWTIFFIVMIVWGLFYLWAYTPELSGWTTHGELVEQIKK